MVHIILVTKYRKKLFFGCFREFLKQKIFEICLKYHWYIKKIEIDKDHVHILLQYNPTDSVARIVSFIKQESTYSAWCKFPDMLRKYYWQRKILWSNGYFVASIGTVSQSVIEHYIEAQG